MIGELKEFQFRGCKVFFWLSWFTIKHKNWTFLYFLQNKKQHRMKKKMLRGQRLNSKRNILLKAAAVFWCVDNRWILFWFIYVPRIKWDALTAGSRCVISLNLSLWCNTLSICPHSTSYTPLDSLWWCFVLRGLLHLLSVCLWSPQNVLKSTRSIHF